MEDKFCDLSFYLHCMYMYVVCSTIESNPPGFYSMVHAGFHPVGWGEMGTSPQTSNLPLESRKI